MHIHTGCICLTFLHCVSSNESSSCLHKKRHSYTGCICLAFRHCGFSNVASTRLHEKRQTYIAGICWSFHRCVFSNVFLNGLHNKRHSQIGCICGVQLHCQLFSYGFLHLHPLKKSNNFPFVWLPFCVVLCPNDCFKLSQIYDWLLVCKCKVCHGILSLFSCTCGSTLYIAAGSK